MWPCYLVDHPQVHYLTYDRPDTPRTVSHSEVGACSEGRAAADTELRAGGQGAGEHAPSSPTQLHHPHCTQVRRATAITAFTFLNRGLR